MVQDAGATLPRPRQSNLQCRTELIYNLSFWLSALDLGYYVFLYLNTLCSSRRFFFFSRSTLHCIELVESYSTYVDDRFSIDALCNVSGLIEDMLFINSFAVTGSSIWSFWFPLCKSDSSKGLPVQSHVFCFSEHCVHEVKTQGPSAFQQRDTSSLYQRQNHFIIWSCWKK